MLLVLGSRPDVTGVDRRSHFPSFLTITFKAVSPCYLLEYRSNKIQMADKILLIKPCLCIEYTCCLGEVNETELLTKFKIATTYLPSSKLKIRALIMLFYLFKTHLSCFNKSKDFRLQVQLLLISY